MMNGKGNFLRKKHLTSFTCAPLPWLPPVFLPGFFWLPLSTADPPELNAGFISVSKEKRVTVPFRIASFFSAYSIFRYLEIQTVFCLFFTVFILGTVIAYPILFVSYSFFLPSGTRQDGCHSCFGCVCQNRTAAPCPESKEIWKIDSV